MNPELIPLLKVHEYFQGVSDDTLEEVERLGRVVQFPAGSIVQRRTSCSPPWASSCEGGSRP